MVKKGRGPWVDFDELWVDFGLDFGFCALGGFCRGVLVDFENPKKTTAGCADGF